MGSLLVAMWLMQTFVEVFLAVVRRGRGGVGEAIFARNQAAIPVPRQDPLYEMKTTFPCPSRPRDKIRLVYQVFLHSPDVREVSSHNTIDIAGQLRGVHRV